jgi:pyridoxine kinase
MQSEQQKRVITIQDISCVGKCSLTVALPILSAAGIETSILPTAILSTHTGGFTGYTFRDLTEDIDPILAHWRTLDLHVEALYTGYLGSHDQLAHMSAMFDEYKKPGTLVFVDPAMADQGKLYPGFDESFALGMRDLCKKADLIAPNLTEAALMLERPYRESGYDQAYIEDLLTALSDLGPKQVVLTGVTFEEGKLGAAAYDRELGTFDYYFSDLIPGYYHGTGDVFSSALLAAIMNDKTLSEAIEVAVEFTVGSIRRTAAAKTEPRFGVDFEHGLGQLIELVS